MEPCLAMMGKKIGIQALKHSPEIAKCATETVAATAGTHLACHTIAGTACSAGAIVSFAATPVGAAVIVGGGLVGGLLAVGAVCKMIDDVL